MENLKEAPDNPLEELGVLALNEEQDTLRITQPYRLAGKARNTKSLAALKEIIEDLRFCGYNTSITTEDTLTSYSILNA